MSNDYNFLRPNSFRMVIKNSPATSFTIQEANIPALMSDFANQTTPFIDTPHPFDKLYHGNLEVEFIVSESMQNYMEIRDWMVTIGFPNGYNDYKEITESLRGRKNSQDFLVSDISLIVLDSDNHELMVVDYLDAFPIQLGSIALNAKMANYNYVSVQATFAYRHNEIRIGEKRG